MVQLPKSTTSRQAYDLLAEGFGPGVNGPFLIAVDFDGSPAHTDKKQLNQVEQQQQQAQQAAVDAGRAATRSRGGAPGRGADGGEQQVACSRRPRRRSRPPSRRLS